MSSLGTLLVSRSAVAVGSIFFSITLVILAAILEMRRVDVIIDLYVDAAAWLIAGLTLSVVMARVLTRTESHRIAQDRTALALDHFCIRCFGLRIPARQGVPSGGILKAEAGTAPRMWLLPCTRAVREPTAR